MRSFVQPSLLAAALFTAASALSTAGCGGGAPLPPPRPPVSQHGEGPVAVKEVSDADFAVALQRVLKDGSSSPERLGLLVGVVRRQLAHASQRFAAGHDAQGTASVIGGLYLVRPGEGRREMIDATGERALASAIERVSPRGDEGRSLALMKMREAALDPASPAKKELEQHLAALEQWMADTRTGGPMRRLGQEERARVARALVQPDAASMEDAATAVNAWITQAIRYNEEFQASHRRPERDEVLEAQRALESGGETMMALFLRSGDAEGALRHVDESNARRVMRPGVYGRLHSAAVSDQAKSHDWLALAAAFAHRDGAEESDPETDIDPELVAAGLWGCAVEAFRREPDSVDAALLLAQALVRLGMPEAAPLVLGEPLQAHATLEAMSAATELLLGAVSESAEADDLGEARRIYAAAGPVLAIADRKDFAGRVEPSPARIRSVMAAVEIRSGNLAEARPLLQLALAAEPTASGFTTLALVERQAQDPRAALAAVEQALRAPDARASLLDVAEAHLTAFELNRDQGATDRAKASLDAALAIALAGRSTGGSARVRARSERLLGRILEGYGEGARSAKAFDRALTIAGGDRPTLGAAMLDAVGRALLRHDLVGARAALKKGLDGDASEDDLVYGGLWVQLLERELHAAPDGSVERALRAGKGGWTGKLTAWANGKLSDADLSAAAQSASQKVEAAFYTAMAKRVSGDPAADQRLKAVATSPVMDLLEVQLARELLAPRMRAELPVNVQLPQ